jgi:hypothetical protein
MATVVLLNSLPLLLHGPASKATKSWTCRRIDNNWQILDMNHLLWE